jgi:hypothetical protein
MEIILVVFVATFALGTAVTPPRVLVFAINVLVMILTRNIGRTTIALASMKTGDP